MEFELDRDGRTPVGERYYVYVASDGKRRCIGQLVHEDGSGLWSAYAEGELLTSAASSDEAALKLWAYEAARRPDIEGMQRKPLWECSIEERFVRIRKKTPRQSFFSERVIRQVRDVPIERRVRLLYDVGQLIEDMEEQLHWWRKVQKELAAAPKLMRYK